MRALGFFSGDFGAKGDIAARLREESARDRAAGLNEPGFRDLGLLLTIFLPALIGFGAIALGLYFLLGVASS
jgi:hypothetical protein